MNYGPIGEAVTAAMPSSEADPIGVYAATLSLFSSAISGRVTMENGRPVVIWTVLAGRSAIGRKGYALNTALKFCNTSLGSFTRERLVSNISSGPSLVNHLWTREMESMGKEGGPDGRAMIIEEEWASILKRSKRCPTFSQQLRTAWDGKPLRNVTKSKNGDGVQEVYRPLLGLHAHITPGEWAKYVTSDEALGGTFNRILPVLVEGSKRLPFDHVHKVTESKALRDAYRWARAADRQIEFTAQAGRRFDQLREVIEERMVKLPEDISCFMERSAEQVARVAAVLTAAERKTKITRKALDAAWAFVEHSMESVEKLVRDAAAPQRTVKPLTDVVRELLVAHGGRATATELHRKVQTRTNAAGLRAIVEEMPDVQVESVKTKPGPGAPSLVFSLVQVGHQKQDQDQDQEKEPEKERPVLRVVDPRNRKPQTRKRTAPKRSTPTPAPQPEPAVPSNPLASLLAL
ncbi:hypothetical protein AB852_00600 [Streptomyces uncialis]|uniref:DUF3987 domain-containing protein n=2 Tax=Streptomyces uncialis TaxID=1048205 RepID=A0A1Q4VFK1_9ACTN|nr:hypothetical protein AB852_00600 [Streptomyces uncialis]